MCVMAFLNNLWEFVCVISSLLVEGKRNWLCSDDASFLCYLLGLNSVCRNYLILTNVFFRVP